MAEKEKKPKKYKIKIDREHFEVEGPTITGTALRTLPDPDIGADRDLYLTVEGGEDRLVGPEDVVDLEKHLKFFTAPATINPGGNASPS